jgi:hypothetical protein
MAEMSALGKATSMEADLIAMHDDLKLITQLIQDHRNECK